MFDFLWKKLNFSRLKQKCQKVLSAHRKVALLSDEYLQKKFLNLRKEIRKINANDDREKFLDKKLTVVFAIIREIIKRKLNLTLFPTQILGGISLYYNNVTQMNTGEGKTLTAILPICLNALCERPVFVITVNNYLSKRDWETSKPILEFLEISSDWNSSELNNQERKNLYEKTTIIYTTEEQLGFDYLKNNLAENKESFFKEDYYYAVIDEVDSILLDKARMPLLISQTKFEKKDIKEEKEDVFLKSKELSEVLKKNIDFKVDVKQRSLWLTELGIRKTENFFQILNLFDFQNNFLNFALHNALKAREFYLNNVDYIVSNNRIWIIDQLTGRIIPNQVYPYGIQQAIETKENVKKSGLSKTVATVTYQNFFRLFEKLSGMTGTAESEQKEFQEVYGMEVVVIPPHRKLIRKDYDDLIFPDKKTKYKSIVDKIKKVSNTTKQPILIGSSSVEVSEYLSRLLSQEGIEHKKLNAVNHEEEAEIISHAGQIGSVIISTNMAGRGTDIILSKESKKVGGLFVLGVEDSFTLRTRQQLRGRSGRQGDPGESVFYVSLEDEIITRFGAKNYLVDIAHGFYDSSLIKTMISEIQESIGALEAQQRQNGLRYDLLIDKQRKIFYNFRKEILFKKKINKDQIASRERLIELFFKRKVVSEMDTFWSDYLEKVDNVRELIGLKVYSNTDPREAFFWETITLFEEAFKKLKVALKKIFTEKSKETKRFFSSLSSSLY